jgi:cytosine/adenosine deaminase-related metal-dependent hydrolase
LGTLLKGGTLVELDPASVEVADLRIQEGKIVARGEAAVAQKGDEVIDVHGKLVLPGLVSAHHRLYSTLLRGAPREGTGFGAEQAALHRLAEALDLDAVQAAAGAGGLEGLSAGTTGLIDLHASPRAVAESLTRVSRGLAELGLRAALGYEVSEHFGSLTREEALDESIAYVALARGRVRGALGASGLDLLSDDALEALREALESGGALLHVTVGEDAGEEERSKQRFGKTPVERLRDAKLVGERTVIAQGVHVSWPELSELLDLGAWLVHSARSNMASQTGTASAAKFGVRACFGTDTQSLDVLAEAQLAWLRARDAGQPIDVLRYLANGHRLMSAAFKLSIGPLRPGSVADVAVYDYRPPTPLNAQTLAQHLLMGLNSRHVESVMVDGIWRLWGRKPLVVKAEDIAAAARVAAKACWARMEKGAPKRKSAAPPEEIEAVPQEPMS